MKNKFDPIAEWIAWWFCNIGIFGTGFAVCAFLCGMSWLALSIGCVSALIFWLGWEIEKAINEEEDRS
jgi:hypothetical protein